LIGMMAVQTGSLDIRESLLLDDFRHVLRMGKIKVGRVFDIFGRECELRMAGIE